MNHNTGKRKKVQATSKDEAIAMAKEELSIGDPSPNSAFYTATESSAAPPVENLEGKPWARWRINATAGRTIPVSARSHAEAIQRCGIPEAQIVSVVIDDGNLTPPQPARREEPDFGEDVPWEIYDRASGERRFVSFMSQANNAQLAASNAVAMLNNINTPQDERRGLGVRMLGGV
jgi:hypothetical protein